MPVTNENRSSIIQAVRTPLGFFTLVILIIESLLGLLAYQSQGSDKIYLILGMLAALVIVVLLVGLSLFKDLATRIIIVAVVSLAIIIIPIQKSNLFTTSNLPTTSLYNLYLISPITSVTPEQYKEIHEAAMYFVSNLRSRCSKFTVYYPGENIIDNTQPDIASVYWSRNVENIISKSENFVLFYPEKVATSALIELGFAIALKKPVHIFVPQKDIMPFLLRDPPPNVHIIEYGRNFSDFKKVIDKDVREIFQCSM
jgi:hypothetical protein